MRHLLENNLWVIEVQKNACRFNFFKDWYRTFIYYTIRGKEWEFDGQYYINLPSDTFKVILTTDNMTELQEKKYSIKKFLKQKNLSLKKNYVLLKSNGLYCL